MKRWIAAILLLCSMPAQAASMGELAQCLRSYDTPCARKQVNGLGGANSSDPNVVAMAAEVSFFEGDYPAAHEALQRAVSLGYNDKYDDATHFERTLFATADWVEERHGRFRIRFRPGLDAMLLEDAKRTLDLSEKHLAPLLGGPPPGDTILEIFPDTRSFIAASSLTADDVYTTGTVALSKWSRLLVTSPRSRARGYGWQDTIAHEYVHLVVAYRGNDQQSVPVWLQEAIAKYLDSRWIDGQDHFRLSVRQSGAIAEALRRDNLVSFDEMHPSLAKMPSAERAALAYAQLASLMSYCFQEGGEEVLIRTMELHREGVDAQEALARGVGVADFDTLEREWLVWLRAQDLDGQPLDELPVVLEGGDDADLDPAIANDRRLGDYLKLGELMARHDQPEAALVEYRKAIPDEGIAPPLLSNRMAQIHIELGDYAPAKQMLEATLGEYPEFSLSLKTLGQVLEGQGDKRGALAQYLEAGRFNPFDPDVMAAVERLARSVGDAPLAERYAAYQQIRRTGGDAVERAVIHEHRGTYELPRYDKHQAKARKRAAQQSRWVGEPAPPFVVLDLKGKEITLSELKGKVVLLDFWATWCGPCRAAMPHIAALYEENKSRGLEVLGLTDEDEKRVRPFLAKTPVPYTIGVRAGDVNSRYEVSSLPTVVVIGRDGRVVDVIVGAGETAMGRIKGAVEEALSK